MIEVPPLDADAVLWSVPPTERAGRPLLVLLHGYGSHEGDLYGLAPYLPDEFVIAAVRAAVTAFSCAGLVVVSIEGLHARSGAAVTASAESLLAWLDAQTDAGPVGLLGFSQGAAIALQALRLQPTRIAFAVALAGFVADEPLPTDAALADARPPVFWGRGARDDVIPAERIAHTSQWLPGHVELSGRVYPDLAHSVSQDELDDVVAFLRRQLAALG